jgi:hypothetical protein
MKTELRPNDLCFIIKALRTENIGKIVTCVQHIGYHERGQPFVWNGETWCSRDTGNLWVVSGNVITLYGKSTQAVIPEHWLKKIEPLDELSEIYSTLENEISYSV